MATLVLGALGTLIGGPVGGAIGALAGRQIDAAVIGSGRREGPRLKDLAISTSSYGQPIPRVYGTARVAGPIIWATDLMEQRSRSGGGKGKPSVTSYSYTSSFAIALSSRPIAGLGRIWADGQLLRGAAGDLKTGGVMRVHTGHSDQPVDPLLASALGPSCPAFRHCAYVVFEDLQLADFGNRLPALSFEVIADTAPLDLAQFVEPLGTLAEATRPLPGLLGFEQTGGTLGDTIALIDRLYPVRIDARANVLALDGPLATSAPVPALPAAASGSDDSAFARQTGRALSTGAAGADAPGALRHYDPERDYQPGMQRREGAQPGTGVTLEYPAVLSAASARSLLRQAWLRDGGKAVLRQYRTAGLDPALAPGAVVTIPDELGRWEIAAWEWVDWGVELLLQRLRPMGSALPATDSGVLVPPTDQPEAPSWLHAFEVPLDDMLSPDAPRRFLAVSSSGSAWSGAALFAEQDGSLQPLGSSGRARAVVGSLAQAAPPSPALMFEPQARLLVTLLSADLTLEPASLTALWAGANRLLVGTEIIQFLDAEPLGAGQWALTGLLRGRAGTEPAAQNGAPVGTPVVLMEGPLVAVDSLGGSASQTLTFAALGLADQTPVTALLSGAGASLRPPCPVHPLAKSGAGGALELRWTRRARGAWLWRDGVDTPLVEQNERYLVGAGAVEQPIRVWEAVSPSLTLQPADLVGLASGTRLWVRQQGSHALSDPALLHTIS